MHVSIWSFTPPIQHVYSPADMPLMCHQMTGRPGVPPSAAALFCTHVLAVVSCLLIGVMSSARRVHARGHDSRQQAAHHSQHPQGRWQHPALP